MHSIHPFIAAFKSNGEISFCISPDTDQPLTWLIIPSSKHHTLMVSLLPHQTYQISLAGSYSSPKPLQIETSQDLSLIKFLFYLLQFFCDFIHSHGLDTISMQWPPKLYLQPEQSSLFSELHSYSTAYLTSRLECLTDILNLTWHVENWASHLPLYLSKFVLVSPFLMTCW